MGPPSVEPTWHPALAALATDYEQIRIASIPLRWAPERVVELLVARADDRVGPILFANLNRLRAFAPYDGGADLFFEAEHDVERRRRRWAEWLSRRKDGL